MKALLIGILATAITIQASLAALDAVMNDTQAAQIKHTQQMEGEGT